MRTDVKLGLTGSFVIVLVAGWFFTGREVPKAAIPLDHSDSTLSGSSVSPTMLTGVDLGEKSRTHVVEPVTDPSTVVRLNPTPSKQNSPLEKIFNANRADKDKVVANAFVEPADDSPLIIDDHQPDKRAEHAPTDTPAATHIAASHPTRKEVHQSSHGQPAVSHRSETHTIQLGDTFASLARRYFGDVRFARTIRSANPQVQDAAAMAIGTVVVIPDVGELSSSRPGTRTNNLAPQHSESAQAVYKVREGDTLYSIARDRLGSGGKWMDIYKINQAVIGGDPGALKIGLKLALPTQSSR